MKKSLAHVQTDITNRTKLKTKDRKKHSKTVLHEWSIKGYATRPSREQLLKMAKAIGFEEKTLDFQIRLDNVPRSRYTRTTLDNKGKVGTVEMGLLGGCKDILFEKMSEQIEKRNEIEQLMTDESEDEKKEEEEETEENKKRREDR